MPKKGKKEKAAGRPDGVEPSETPEKSQASTQKNPSLTTVPPDEGTRKGSGAGVPLIFEDETEGEYLEEEGEGAEEMLPIQVPLEPCPQPEVKKPEEPTTDAPSVSIAAFDKFLIKAGYRDRLFGTQICPEPKRKDFTAFLSSSGIIRLISGAVLTLEQMKEEERPLPEQVINFFLKFGGSKLANAKEEMEENKEALLAYLEELRKENDALKRKLENFMFLTTPYETLNPDEFLNLAGKFGSVADARGGGSDGE